MAKKKRARADGESTGAESVHPSRKRRLGYNEADAKRAGIFQALADDLHTERIKAAGELLTTLSAESSDQVQQIDNTLDRLIKGLCSGRKAARLGFSVALAETLRLAFRLAEESNATQFNLDSILHKIFAATQIDGNASGQEKREHLLGRWFAYQAILQSDIAISPKLPTEHYKTFVDAIADLSSQKLWLRSECGAMLYEFFNSTTGLKLNKDRTLQVIGAFHERDLLKTPEGVALWLLMVERYPASDLPKGVWHNNDPLCANERTRLKKVLNGTAIEEEKEAGASTGGARQVQPSFAWKVIISKLFQRDDKAFQQFWTEAVDNGLFSTSSSVERKALGLQIVLAALAIAPTSRTIDLKNSSSLQDVLSINIVRCLINQRASAERYLFEASKVVLHQIVARAKAEPASCEDFIKGLLEADAVNFDQITKTKVLDTILQSADEKGLKHIVRMFEDRIQSTHGQDGKDAESRHRLLFDNLPSLLRTHADPEQLFKSGKNSSPSKLASWVADILKILVEHGFGDEKLFEVNSTVFSRTQTLARTRLTSCLRMLLNQPIELAMKSVFAVVKLLRERGLPAKVNSNGNESLIRTDKILVDIEKTARSSTGSKKSAIQAYGLLFALSMLQVYNEEPESVEILDDLLTSFQSWQNDDEDAASMIIEILLSFVSKPSQLFRKLAEQVFTTFAFELTSDGLQSMLDILVQKENLSGQQELFDQHNETGVVGAREYDEDSDEGNEDEAGEGDDSDVEIVDVDDMEGDSDIEITGGQVVIPTNGKHETSDDDNDEESSEIDSGDSVSSDEEAEGDAGEYAADEEAAFDRKLAAALQTSGTHTTGDDDEDEHGSDMDDEQMMAVDSHLTTIFQERKKSSSKKKENKDAKENIINFKNRVLDLLAIFVKEQPGHVLTLDLIHPLTSLVRTTSSKPTSEKAFGVLKTLFETCSKQKKLPQTDDVEACFQVLAAVHEETELGGSKLHANACSRSSLFLAKVLVAINVQHYTRIAGMYAALQSEWYSNPKSIIQGSIFTEWTSWSLTTKKQK